MQRSHKKITPKNATPDQYKASSIIRFGRLKNYIQEKLIVDYFAVRGNLLIMEGLRTYIKNNLKKLEKVQKIKILDVGPAIGAMSTMVTLQTLAEFNLAEKASIYLTDVSGNVIDFTQKCDFSFPDSLINPNLKGLIFRKLRQSKSYVGSAENLPWKHDHFDITLAGYLFHHLHDSLKPTVANEIVRVLKPGGFFGIAEEWFEDYKKFEKRHKDDTIPLAYESIISIKNMCGLLEKTNIFFKQESEHCYSICTTKSKKSSR